MSEFPLPDTDWPPTRPFWEAAARGSLEIPRCAACGAWNWYPPERCRTCGSPDLGWEPVSGRGRLYAWAVVRRALARPFSDQVPYVAALVSLDEDPRVRLVTKVVDCDPDALRAELPLQVVFRPLRFPQASREVVAPLFAPAV